MAWTLLRTWSAAWLTITRHKAFGEVGTAAITYGSFGSWTFSLVFLCAHRYTNRYIYVPLGGTKNVVFTTVLVFSFVALWHDLSFRLLTWGWLVSLFILPELSARYLLPSSKASHQIVYLLYHTQTYGL